MPSTGRGGIMIFFSVNLTKLILLEMIMMIDFLMNPFVIVKTCVKRVKKGCGNCVL